MPPTRLTQDAEPHYASKPEWMDVWQARNASIEYGRKLRGLADRLVAYIRDVAGPDIDTAEGLQQATRLLMGYTEVIRPWAEAVANRMVTDVALRDARIWRSRSRNISQGVYAEMLKAPIADALAAMRKLQVELITSIPIGVAEQISNLVIPTAYTGERAGSLVNQIMQIGDVTRARANLIARTEVARTQTEIMKTRAQHAGSTHYIWRTAGDEDVRPSLFLPSRTFNRMNTKARGSHRLLEGTVHSWSDPPISGPRGERAHPGCIYNCRCIPEPIFRDDDHQIASWRWAVRPASSNFKNPW